MTQSINIFKPAKQKGELTLLQNWNIFTFRVDASEVGSLKAGDPVVVVGATAGEPMAVKKATALTDKIFGFVRYSRAKESFVAYDNVDVAFNDDVMIMEASAAISAGARVQIDPSTSKIATLVAPNTLIGYALSKADGNGSLISVLIKTPSAMPDYLDGITATVAEINKLDLSAETETIVAAGAVSVTKRYSKLEVVSGGAVTLAVPDASMIGLPKVIEMTVDDGNVTLALTNVQGGSAATTCTWANVGEALVLVASASKWNVISEGGVVLS